MKSTAQPSKQGQSIACKNQEDDPFAGWEDYLKVLEQSRADAWAKEAEEQKAKELQVEDLGLASRKAAAPDEADLEKQLQDAKADLEKLTQQLKDAKAAAEAEAKAELEKLTQQLKDEKDAAAADLEKQIEDAHANLVSENGRLVADNSRLTQQLQDEKDQLTQQLQDEKDQLAEATKKLEVERTEFEERKKNVCAAVKDERARIAEATKKLEDERTEFEKRKEEERAQLAEAAKKLEDEQAKLLSAETEVTSAETQPPSNDKVACAEKERAIAETEAADAETAANAANAANAGDTEDTEDTEDTGDTGDTGDTEDTESERSGGRNREPYKQALEDQGNLAHVIGFLKRGFEEPQQSFKDLRAWQEFKKWEAETPEEFVAEAAKHLGYPQTILTALQNKTKSVYLQAVIYGVRAWGKMMGESIVMNTKTGVDFLFDEAIKEKNTRAQLILDMMRIDPSGSTEGATFDAWNAVPNRGKNAVSDGGWADVGYVPTKTFETNFKEALEARGAEYIKKFGKK